MSVTVLTLDGNDLGVGLGLILDSRITGWRDMMEVGHEFGVVPDKIAQQLLTVQVQARPRTFSLRGILEAPDRLIATLNSNRDTLKYRLNKGEITATLAWDATRHFKCYANPPAYRVTPIHPAITQATEECALNLIAYDPREYDNTVTTVAAFTADTAHPLGTAPVGAVFDVSGTTFTLTYKDFGGTVIQTFVVTGATGTSPITVDMERQTVIDSVGVKQDQFITGGDFFILDPNDGDFELANWPTVGCGSSTASTYNKAYL